MTNFKTIACFGTGTMGSAIAAQFALAGLETNLFLHHPDQQEIIQARLNAIILEAIDHQLTNDNLVSVNKRLHFHDNYADTLANADFVTESISEDLALKQTVWHQIEQHVTPTTILSTNTSGLSPDDIAKVLTHPERFVVAHFWNPAQLMPLVEVVPGQATTDATVKNTVALMRQLGKHPVALKHAALGFVGNRIQAAVLREALHIVDEGIASPAAVDEVVKYSLGRRWNLVGPIASADLGGLDVFDNISKYLYADLDHTTTEDPRLQAKVANHELGLKTGHGFYDWDGDQGASIVAERNAKLIDALKHDHD